MPRALRTRPFPVAWRKRGKGNFSRRWPRVVSCGRRLLFFLCGYLTSCLGACGPRTERCSSSLYVLTRSRVKAPRAVRGVRASSEQSSRAGVPPLRVTAFPPGDHACQAGHSASENAPEADSQPRTCRGPYHLKHPRASESNTPHEALTALRPGEPTVWAESLGAHSSSSTMDTWWRASGRTRLP